MSEPVAPEPKAPAEEPAGKSANEPVTVTEPAAEPAAKPVAKPAAKPVAKPAAEPVVKPAAEPVAKPANEPVAEAAGPGPLRRLVEQVVAGPDWVVTILAILLALLAGGVLIAASDQAVLDKFGYFFASPGDALGSAWSDVSGAYAALFRGAIFDPNNAYDATHFVHPITETITEATPLIFGGLAVGLAFRAGLFNIGGQGQLIIGAICACYAGFTVTGPPVIAMLVALVAGIAGGALYGGLAGWLKAGPGAHEVIVTIMLNYVATDLLRYLIKSDAFRDPNNPQPVSKPVSGDARLPHLLGDSLRLNAGILFALAAVAFAWWLLNRSTLGFQLRAVGANQRAARTAGMSVGRNQIMAMVLSGGLMGLVGVSQVLGTANANNALTPQIDAGLGFTAITVALLGRASPLGITLAALLFGALQAGGREMQASAGVSIQIVTVIQALIVLFVAAPGLVKEIFRLRGARGADAGLAAKGWNG